ncbi:MAG: threonine synthase [Actinobacteria bacterium]|nr:threonine synthase [Actinomycetota bacterium]
MRYLSTRGAAPRLSFGDVLLEGLARDGGLYVPESVPRLTAAAGSAYARVAEAAIAPYVTPDVARRDLARAIDEAYASFDHPDVCPIVRLEDGLYVQELFHGPTLAFKDVALQLVGRLMDAELERRDDRRTIVVATSGDTGSAAIAACVGRDRLDIVVLHPAGRTSDVQRRQMTTVDAPNVHNVAVEGTFDDCQDLVKALFADEEFRDEQRLGAMNSINWGRVVAQIPYYVSAAREVAPAGEAVAFAVPSGNFGNVLAGWYARAMGLAVRRLVIGSNRNDILARWVSTGALVAEDVVPTLSPSMDIQVSSNHERLVFELLGRDGGRTADLMARFRGLGSAEAPRSDVFLAARLDDDETLAEIRLAHERWGYLADPHTAIGIGAARRLRESGSLDPDVSVVCLATAHPAKFPDAVRRATGISPPRPERLDELFDRPERYDVVPADLRAVQDRVRSAAAAAR